MNRGTKRQRSSATQALTHASFRHWSALGVILLALGRDVAFPNQPQVEANRFESEIEQFEAVDKTNPPPRHAVLFIGSSSIRLWPNLQQAFPGHRVLQRGFGGSELSDSVWFADRIVLPYEPRLIFLYAGDNDLANGKSPQRVLADFEIFERRIHSALPRTVIGYIAIKPSLARRKLLGEIQITNRLIRGYVKANHASFFIDVFPPCSGPTESHGPNYSLQTACTSMSRVTISGTH